MTKVLLAEDHALVREGLKLLLAMRLGLDVVGETGDGAAVERLACDLEIMCLVARGMSNQDIATVLHVSLHTVRTHRRRVISPADRL